jgi:homospermidine synthase
VTSAVISGLAWALEHPNEGIVEADDMDFKFCLDHQLPYLGNVFGCYTDWNPLHGQGLFPVESSDPDPWQFSNVLVK